MSPQSTLSSFAFEILECRSSRKGGEMWNILRPASHTIGESLPCITMSPSYHGLAKKVEKQKRCKPKHKISSKNFGMLW